MSLFRSAEIRWVFEGKPKQGIKSWFRNGGYMPSEETRKDQYLIFPGMEKIGIKLRQSKLEFKPIIQSNIDIALPSTIVGKPEVWEKWSIEDSEAGEFLYNYANNNEEHWINVEKSRLLRKFSADNGAIKEVNASERPNEGCGIEITELKIRKLITNADSTLTEYWSFGLEAFGGKDNICNILEQSINKFMSDDLVDEFKELSLTIDNSMSYPEFLFTISKTR